MLWFRRFAVPCVENVKSRNKIETEMECMHYLWDLELYFFTGLTSKNIKLVLGFGHGFNISERHDSACADFLVVKATLILLS